MWVDSLQAIAINVNSTKYMITKYRPVDILHGDKKDIKSVDSTMIHQKHLNAVKQGDIEPYRKGQLVRLSMMANGTYKKLVMMHGKKSYSPRQSCEYVKVPDAKNTLNIKI